MKIRIDDIRKAPNNDWITLKSVNETIEVFEYIFTAYKSGSQKHIIEIIDLDHDAGNYVHDGGDYIKILNYLEEYSEIIKEMNIKFHIHSMNPVGRNNMERIIERNGWNLIK